VEKFTSIPTIASTVSPVTFAQSEAPPGSIHKIAGKSYKLVIAEKAGTCRGCDLYVGGICQKTITCPCLGYSRTDKQWLHFKLQ